MGPAFRQYLDGAKVYGCAACKTHVADHDDVVSKVREGARFFPPSERAMTTDDDLLSKPFQSLPRPPLVVFF